MVSAPVEQRLAVVPGAREPVSEGAAAAAVQGALQQRVRDRAALGARGDRRGKRQDRGDQQRAGQSGMRPSPVNSACASAKVRSGGGMMTSEPSRASPSSTVPSVRT